MGILKTSFSGKYKEESTIDPVTVCKQSFFDGSIVYGNKENPLPKQEDYLYVAMVRISADDVIRTAQHNKSIFEKLHTKIYDSNYNNCWNWRGRVNNQIFADNFNITEYISSYNLEGNCQILYLFVSQVKYPPLERYREGSCTLNFTHINDMLMFKLRYPGLCRTIGK